MHTQAAPGDVWSSFIFLTMLMLVAYFVFIRPQAKRSKAHSELLTSIQAGDEVTTTGGMMGIVKKIYPDAGYLQLNVATGTVICIQIHAVVAMLPKGTIEPL